MARASQRPARSASVAALLCPIVVAACGSSSSGPTFTTEDAGLDASTTNSSDGATEQNIAPPDAARESSPSIDSAGADTASVAHQDGGSQINQDASNGANPDAGPSDAATQDAPTGDAANTTIPMEVTFYGWADNSPPGNAIAYPANGGQPTIHNAAGGTGTYADPITFATAPTEFSPGTRLYVPFIEKYVVMEDSCGQCTTDWSNSRKYHIDLWMNSNGTESTSALTNCEDSWTRAQTDVEINPPPTRTVTTPPLFDPATNMCRTSP